MLRWDDNLINCTHISRVPREEEEKKKKKKEKRQRCSRLLEREVVFNWFRGKFNLQALTEDWNSKIHPHFNPRPTRINRVRVGTWLIRVNEKRRYLFFFFFFYTKVCNAEEFWKARFESVAITIKEQLRENLFSGRNRSKIFRYISRLSEKKRSCFENDVSWKNTWTEKKEGGSKLEIF